MKTRVVFEFDLEGCEAYSDITNGACKENLIDLFYKMLHSLTDDIVYAKTDETIIGAAYLAALEQDVIVVKRILAGLKSIEKIGEET